MNDSHIFINARTPGYQSATVNNRVDPIEILLDREYSDVGGVESFVPYLTCSDEDASDIQSGLLIEIDTIKYRAASNPESDGTGLSTVRLEDYYE